VIFSDVRLAGRITTKRVALFALVVFIFEEAVSALVFLSMNRYQVLRGTLLLPFATWITHWMLPLFIVFFVERRNAKALGFTVKRGRAGRYALFALIGLVLPTLILGVDRMLAIDFVKQIVQIGVAEEVLFRGYLLHRLAEWRGNHTGLILGGLTFGFAHIVSRVSQHGLAYPLHDVTLGFQTFLGGLLFGLIYLRVKSIIPGAILHVSTNLYLERFIEVLGRLESLFQGLH
jgi:membrane protease YdiL (CAAX protease family)